MRCRYPYWAQEVLFATGMLPLEGMQISEAAHGEQE